MECNTENFSMEWNMEENFSVEWKKIASMEYSKIVFHSIPCLTVGYWYHAACTTGSAGLDGYWYCLLVVVNSVLVPVVQ